MAIKKVGYTIVQRISMREPEKPIDVLHFTRRIYHNEEIAQQAIKHIVRDYNLRSGEQYRVEPVYMDVDDAVRVYI